MNVAAFIIAAMNIHHIIECSPPDSATFDILFCLCSHFVLLPCPQILLRHCPWRNFRNLPSSWELTSSGFPDPSWIISPYLTECAFPSGRGSSRWGATCCIISQEVFSGFLVSIVRPQLHLSTLEKTKIDHNPLLNNQVVTSSQVSPIDRHLQQIFQDLDIHTRSSPGLMKLWKTRPKASSL